MESEAMNRDIEYEMLTYAIRAENTAFNPTVFSVLIPI
jgi:hypothetical protein